jgi:carbon starvation protein
MNSLFLIITAVIAFIFGYRFYSKLLAGVVFRLGADPGIATENTSRDRGKDGENRYLLMGQHFGIVATAATMSGAALAAYWGWVPAFLWVLVGTAVAAGAYSIGSLWLSVHHRDETLGEIASHYFRPQFHNALLILILIVLMTLATLLALLSASLLVNHPSAVMPFCIQVLVASVLGIFLRQRVDKFIAPASAFALLLMLLVIWWLGSSALGFSGAFDFDLQGSAVFTLDAEIAWVILLAAYLYNTQRPPFARLLRPRAWFAALLFVLLLLIFFIGVAVAHPTLLAPGFNPAGTSPTALPSLLVTVTGGALAGIYLLFAHHFTAPALRRETDARQVGYGAAVLEGLAAISAIIVCSAGFATVAEWNQFYASWSSLQDPGYLLELYVNGFVYFTSNIGIGAEFAANLATVALLALSITTLEAVLRLLRSVMSEAGEVIGVSVKKDSRRSLTLVLFVIVVIAAGAMNAEVNALVPLFGIGNQLLAAIGLLLLVAVLEKRQQPGQFLLGMTLLLLPATIWATWTQLAGWWHQGQWSLVALSLLLFAIGVWIFIETVQILWKPGEDPGRA